MAAMAAVAAKGRPQVTVKSHGQMVDRDRDSCSDPSPTFPFRARELGGFRTIAAPTNLARGRKEEALAVNIVQA